MIIIEFHRLEKLIIIQFHNMEKMLIIQFHSMEKMFIMLFSYKFGHKKTVEKAQILVPEYRKNACYEIL